MDKVTIAAMNIAPGKAMGLCPVSVMRFDGAGPRGDRVLGILDAERNRLVTQRTHPHLVLAKPEWLTYDPDQGVLLQCPGLPQLTHRPDFDGRRVVGVRVSAAGRTDVLDQGDKAADWATRLVNLNRKRHEPQTAARLVWLPPHSNRLVVEPFTPVPVSLVDGFPLLVTSRASHQDVCRRFCYDFSEARWRSGLVTAGLAPWEEDDVLEAIVVGRGVKLVFEKLNARCTVINVMPHRGIAGPDLLTQLAEFRTMREPTTEKPGIMFGVNARVVASSPYARICLGDEVRVTKRRPRP